MKSILIILSDMLIIGLFLYSKLLPYKGKLDNKYKKAFNYFESFFSPVLNLFKTFIKPLQVGQGLSVDMAQIVLLIVLLFITSTL